MAGYGLCAAAVMALLSGAVGAEPAAAGPPAGQGRWIVSPRSYWRYHWTFRPSMFLATDGALVAMPTRYGALNTPATGNQLTTADPPDDWASADFDDSEWCVLRAPLPMMPEIDQDGSGPYGPHIIRRFSGRTRFVVKDPTAVRRLRLEVAYAGGLIVSVNGREVGRGHIPGDGPLAPAGLAEPYRPEAYLPVTEEQKAWGLTAFGFWSAIIWHPWRFDGQPDGAAMQQRIRKVVALRERRLILDVDPKVLRAGVNVLGVENRLSPVIELKMADGKTTLPPIQSGANAQRWPHIGISDMTLTADPASSLDSADRRPDGVQAWAEDIHRQLLDEDFLEPGVKERGTITIVGARGGTFSGQVVIGTDWDLGAPGATASDLVAADGARIPSEALLARWAKPLPVKLIKQTNPGAFRTYMQDLSLIRYRGAPADTWVAYWSDHRGKGRLLGALWRTDTMRLYDQLSPEAPARIAAGTSQPVWLTVRVPGEAQAGVYSGTLTVRAEGMRETVFQVRVEVLDAAVPPPQAYRTYVGVDESPWALAAWAKVRPWSPEHWVLVEQAVRAAGQLGARVVSIPVIHQTELDNEQDTMIKWVRRPVARPPSAGGEPPAQPGATAPQYDYDFSVADRYLDLWKRHAHPETDVIVYLVHPADVYGKGGGTGTVNVIDPATGAESALQPPTPDRAEGRAVWIACAKAIHAHLRARGFADRHIHWGLFYDYIGDRGFALAEALAEAVPGVGWARSSHEGRKIHGGHDVRVSWSAAVRCYQRPPFTLARMKGKPYYYFDPAQGYRVEDYRGWSDTQAALLLPRADSDVSALGMHPPLFHLRSTQEMAVTTRYRGLARISVDGWGRGSYFGPFNPYLLYPGGPGRMDGSIQFEVLREGLQEVETRVALGEAAADTAARQVLDRRTERLWVLPPRPEGQRIGEYHADWQRMSRDLYAAVAEHKARVAARP